LQALPKISDLVEHAKTLGCSALALTDNGNLYGAIDFYKECKGAGIKAIIGCDLYIAARTRFDKQSGVDSRGRTRILVLARNLEGYKTLMRLVTDSYLEGFYYKPRVDHDLLSKHHEGLIAIAPTFSSDIAQALKNGDKAKALELVTFYKNLYGATNFYIEIVRHKDNPEHVEISEKMLALARETQTPILACHDVFYLLPEDKAARNTLMMVQTSGDPSERFGNDPNDYSFVPPEEMKKRFADIPDAYENVEKLVEEINLDVPLGKWVFPDIKIPEGTTYDGELKRIVYEGFPRRGVPQSEEIVKRVEYELSVIKQKGYAPYFLVVADLLRYARENGILSNIRGSVSGSMVTYLSGITNIDPLEYQIPFERFLNPERPSAPDIDMDYADNRRDEMFEYIKGKYGADRIAQIGTFGTMMARGSVRDTSRALGFSYEIGDQIAKLIPMGKQGFPMTIDLALEEVPELKKLYDEDEDVKTIIDMARKIEGCARHISVHAAGTVIAPSALTDFTPIQYDTKEGNKIITQYDMYSVEDAGLLKFDFLGLTNLSIIKSAIDLVRRHYGIEIDIDKVAVNDKKTFEMLARGETVDTFQLNGDGMTRFLMELKPTTIHDINAMVALYRPGPIQFIPEYIARKHGKSPILYLDPALEPILEKTYGILVYQDDLLMMAHKLAGYSWGEVDKFRKAVGKKIPEEMALQKEKFIQGCVKYSGWELSKAQEIWKWIEPFASYGFNKAHSVSYGRVAYITAYLKANYPVEYMTATLNAETGEIEKVGVTVAECKRMGLLVLPPDINSSFENFTAIKGVDGTPDTIRFGLTTIKNFGEGIAKAIITERQKNGTFTSLANFLERVLDRNLNKKSLEALIMAGALDAFGERGTMLANIERLLAFNKEHSKNTGAMDSLFGGLEQHSSEQYLKLEPTPPTPPAIRLAWEKELLGLYVSGHPLDPWKKRIEEKKSSIATTLTTAKNKQPVLIAGIIEEVKEIQTKNKELMAFVKLADFTGSIETVVFPKTYPTLKEILKQDAVVAIKGTLSKRDDEWSILVDGAKKLES
jgi:DNA polymerase-3 subunit alpha